MPSSSLFPWLHCPRSWQAVSVSPALSWQFVLQSVPAACPGSYSSKVFRCLTVVVICTSVIFSASFVCTHDMKNKHSVKSLFVQPSRHPYSCNREYPHRMSHTPTIAVQCSLPIMLGYVLDLVLSRDLKFGGSLQGRQTPGSFFRLRAVLSS